MWDKVLVGTAVWMISNKTGRKIGAAGFKILTQLGNHVVGSMPPEIAGAFSTAESFLRGSKSEGGGNDVPISTTPEEP